MKHTESTWERYRYLRVAAAILGLSLALLAMLFPARSAMSHGLLIASLTLTAVGVLVLARRPGHRPNVFEIVFPIATLAILVLSALHFWR